MLESTQRTGPACRVCQWCSSGYHPDTSPTRRLQSLDGVKSYCLEGSYGLGEANQVAIVDPSGSEMDSTVSQISVANDQPVEWQKQKLTEIVGELKLLDSGQREQLLQFLMYNHFLSRRTWTRRDSLNW